MSSTPKLLSRIQTDWQRVRPGLDAAPMLTYLLVSRLQAALAKQVERTHRHSGLNAATWDLLMTLRRSAPDEGLTPAELAQLTALTGASITNRIDNLRARGLAERRTNPLDRRSAFVRLTPAGRALADELLPIHLANETAIFEVLDDQDRADLQRLAFKLLEPLERGEEG
ncbi:MarR family transcriptional regulator [Deinococcus psychrotolerans]|uniref:MarR family transcriptional regulator n=1 Tax=Deinococcus psychrotolerans TaxID=2489213 RepID=A0A3G8YDC7_9DEIO|nr:MarR family transcriptional regulator [Deinococcus psychrotolerans]AZI42985.1 MarR family transcriptional regulator [Deinococcus psychrotolerans]